MPKFSNASLQKLFTCDLRLQKLFNEVIKETDIIILCGRRNKEDQEKAFRERNSKVHYPNSKHNADPSRAVDFAPYYAESPHIHWNDINGFIEASKVIKRIAEELGIEIEYGGDWKSFKDYPHVQLKDED